ncbi:ABC transporter permease/M1 family aminopeptidase [Flavobacterium lindanitolerans]|uniref:ABC transporter permease/M1 family aminopeptidase n=1 Tax=Flavobacterium lindanitolerans TaxID=428988 RepID=UPI002809F643|nr:M1 family aminopeptidase [Flavobacterium lindanitolerans]MDQ7960238.1 M1 family aminopeptidase [Flavobacterium lindanitolerans]
MFSTIFNFELKRWFRNPSFYIFAALFFGMSFLFAAANFGVFDDLTAARSSNAYANSPTALNGFINGMNVLIYFLLPIIVGSSVYRDFRFNMHTILFSYPFTKLDYIAGKFLSSLFVVILITLTIILGIVAASVLPWVNHDLLLPFNPVAYAQIYLIYVIPNLFFFGVLIFALVTISRNISVGFIGVILLLLLQVVLSSFTQDIDNRYVVALWEPFGMEAASYYTKYWTIAEQNENLLPFEGVIIYNRLIWMGISLVILGLLYYYFSFSQTALTIGKSKKGERAVKNNFGGITRIELPVVKFDFSNWQNLKTAWSLSNVDFKFILKNWAFIVISIVGLLFLLLVSISTGSIFGTDTYPVTWQMLEISGGSFSLFINVLTFLFAGILIHRADTTRMSHLIDVTPIPNWVLLFSKFLAIVKMQIALLILILVAGVLIQSYHGYYNFEIGHYLVELYGIKIFHFMAWAFMAVFIQTIFKNYLLGFFILMLLSIGIQFLSQIGIEQDIFRFNSDTRYAYSDMNGYGHSLNSYYLYKLYWNLLGIVLFCIALLFWKRGIPMSIKERFANARKRFSPKLAIPMIVALVGFLAIGSAIYYEDNVRNPYYSQKENEKQAVEWEKKYKKYEHYAQPRITDINVNMDIYPKSRDFKAKGYYFMKNKSKETIDSIFLNYNGFESKFRFNRETELVSKDTLFHFNIYRLKTPLAPGDSIKLEFEVYNKPNTFITSHSPVLENGTFINNSYFPSIGYSESGELWDDETRAKYGLKPKERMAKPTDSIARQNTYISNDADWVNFETTVSTSDDQIAIAPGYLEKQWKENGRNYFHYKMDQKMLNFYAYQSARYEVKKDKWKDVNIEIYYQKGHEYNIDRMIKGIKKSLEYYTENFGPYQHKQARIIEFPRTGGGFAQSFANTIPYSEAVGFIAHVKDEDEDAVDYPFSITSHEMAHQWWAHQVIGANVQGATLMSESLSEYSSLKVLEHEYGKSQMRMFLKDALDSYLMGRTFESKKEQPLMYNENQQYIHYNKGSLVLYALSDYIGEKNMNNALKKYRDKVAYQEAPYTNSIEFVSYLNEATPDSLKYMIKDMFETITLYDNRIKNFSSKKLPNGKYEVTIDALVSKYRSDEKGKRSFKDESGKTLTYKGKGDKHAIESYPLNDYVEVGVFGEQTVKGKVKEKELYLKKHKITQIDNKFVIIVDEKPVEVGIDPYNKLIDTNSNDNRRKN